MCSQMKKKTLLLQLYQMEKSHFFSIKSKQYVHFRSCSESKLSSLSLETCDSEDNSNMLDGSFSQNMSRSSLQQQNNYIFKKHENKVNYCIINQTNQSSGVKNKKTDHYQQCSKQLTQIYDIQRKTGLLVIKQRQQRKQLKKIKKIYQEKVDELKLKQQQQQKQEKAYLMNLQSHKYHQCQLIQEKNKLVTKILQLERAIQQLQLNLKASCSEKQILWNKIEFIDANCLCGYQDQLKQQRQCQDRFEEIIYHAQQYNNIDRQINILDKTIKDKTKTAANVEDYKEIMKMYELRKSFQQKKRDLLIQKQTHKLKKTIEKLNFIIINNYKKINALHQIVIEDNSKLKQLQLINRKKYEIQSYDNNKETCENFYAKQSSKDINIVSKQSQWSFIEPLLGVQRQQKLWQNVKEATSQLISKYTITGHQKYYEILNQFLQSMFSLFNKKIQKEQILYLIEQFFSESNRIIISKARKSLDKIQQLMVIVNNQNKIENNITKQNITLIS